MRPPTHRPWVIAHRGASAAFRENTLEAFRAAAAMGADAVELDVRRSVDGVPMVHHDAMVPGIGPIVAHTAADLRRQAPWLPTLTEALEACPGLWVDVEVKNSPADPDWDPDDRLVEAVLARLPGAADRERILFSSFNPLTLARAHALDPGLATGCLVDRPVSPDQTVSDALRNGHGTLLPRAAFLAGTSARDWVEAARGAGLRLLVWTVDQPDEMRRLAGAGVDGLITNRPDAALSALGQHRDGRGR